jgi:hypothetical protein
MGSWLRSTEASNQCKNFSDNSFWQLLANQRHKTWGRYGGAQTMTIWLRASLKRTLFMKVPAGVRQGVDDQGSKAGSMASGH